MKVVGMAVRDIEVTRGGDEVELFGRRIALEPPTAPVHGTDEPRVGGEKRPTVFEQDEGGVTQRSEFETDAARGPGLAEGASSRSVTAVPHDRSDRLIIRVALLHRTGPSFGRDTLHNHGNPPILSVRTGKRHRRTQRLSP